MAETAYSAGRPSTDAKRMAVAANTTGRASPSISCVEYTAVARADIS